MNKKLQDSAPNAEVDKTRRDILRYFTLTAGCFIAPASARALENSVKPSTTESKYRFPQGIASADPQSDAVVLWTRVDGDADSVPLTVQVSETADFDDIVSESSATATPDMDHTVRVLVTDLSPDRYYYYRFIAPDGGVSRTGRSRTAPHPDSDRKLNVAVFSCQDYELGYFTAYQRMLLDEEAAGAADQIDFAIHLGDFIYETARRPETMNGSGRGPSRAYLYNRDGSKRTCTPLPSGGELAGRQWVVPTNLDDYRALYKAYLLDPDLQEVRANYPFVQTWDDHEFKNDAWQSYFEEDGSPTLRVAANKAWFEFIPAALSMGGRDVEDHDAADFKNVTVVDRPAGQFDHNHFSLEENNVAAVGSMTIYRSLRWGRMAEIFVADTRSYRGPRGFPQELLTVGNHPYPPAPIDPALIDILNRGSTALEGNPPAEIEYLGQRLANPRKDAPFSSMLGGKQKAWLKEGLAESPARWKLLGLSVGLMRHGFDSSFRDDGFANGIMWTDGWDGYPAERAEHTEYIRDESIANVVSLTGDRHIHMAGLVHDNFDREGSRPVAAEFAGGATSATLRMTIQRRITSHDEELESLVVCDGKPHDYENEMAPSLNAWLIYGAATARAIHDGMDEAEAIRLDNEKVNRHMHYADADAHGYFVARFDRDRCDVEFVTVEEPVVLPEEGQASVRRRVRFSVDAWTTDDSPALQLKGVSGKRPLGGLRS